MSESCEQTEYPVYVRNVGFGPHIYVQIEPLNEHDNYNHLKINPDIIEIWDYCENNVRILKNQGIQNVKKLNLQLWEDYRNKLISFNPENVFDYDVVFVGWVNQRREKILNQLIKHGLNVLILGYGDGVYGANRDKIIAKSEVLLNSHYHESTTCFEWFRCYPWISLNKKIISENSYCFDNRIDFIDYENMVKHVIKYFEHK